MKKTPLLVAFIILCHLLPLVSQSGVKISTQPIPDQPGAILNVQSASQGVLLPRTTVDSILFPVNGLVIYDTMDNHFKYFKDTTWVTLLESTSFLLSYADHDGDTYGDALSAVYAPFIPAGYVLLIDCDDSNPAIAPGQPEWCDGVDNDCNPLTADGTSEMSLGQTCDGADLDFCQEGVYQCVNGALVCSDVSDTNFEVCDGMDNNCDGVVDEGCPFANIDFAILQFPPSIFTLPNVSYSIYGQVFSLNVTEGMGQGPGITAQLGFGPDNSDPALGGWTWIVATYNSSVVNNDEYQATLNVSDIGMYDYAFRFSGDYGVNWTYADVNGTTDGYQIENAGALVVVDDLCNGTDDDLDGFIDENCTDLGQPCDGADADLCEDGIVVCLMNGDCGCNDDGNAIPEICDGEDDDCDGMIDEDCTEVIIAFGNLQFPPTISMPSGQSPTIYGQVYATGVTDMNGQGPGILAEVGYGPDGSDPSSGGWSWFPASFNTDVVNNDEYQGTLTVPAAGQYDYAYRYSGNDGYTWLYCDVGAGSADGYSPANAGQLTVN